MMKAYYAGAERDKSQLRLIGILMACYDEDNAQLLYPIKITSKPISYESALVSKSDPRQGFSDDEFEDEEEFEDEYEDEYEDEFEED